MRINARRANRNLIFFSTTLTTAFRFARSANSRLCRNSTIPPPFTSKEAGGTRGTKTIRTRLLMIINTPHVLKIAELIRIKLSCIKNCKKFTRCASHVKNFGFFEHDIWGYPCKSGMASRKSKDAILEKSCEFVQQVDKSRMNKCKCQYSCKKTNCGYNRNGADKDRQSLRGLGTRLQCRQLHFGEVTPPQPA